MKEGERGSEKNDLVVAAHVLERVLIIWVTLFERSNNLGAKVVAPF